MIILTIYTNQIFKILHSIMGILYYFNLFIIYIYINFSPDKDFNFKSI